RKHEPVAFELPPLDTAADTVTAAATIVAAVAAGELAPTEAADIAKVVDIYVRALATQGFEERLAKLERGPPAASGPANADAGRQREGRESTHAAAIAAAAAVAAPAEQDREN